VARRPRQPSGAATGADNDHRRIQVFNADDAFVVKKDEAAAGNGRFVMPVGVAVDGRGTNDAGEFGAARVRKLRLLKLCGPKTTAAA
jgi:hypothetical protein